MGYMTDGLTFNTLRGANIARLPQFKNALGEQAHNVADGSDWTPAQWLQALVGELGEYANFRKKFERGDIDEAKFSAEASKELADVQIYLDILAYRLGIDLGRATMDKFNEVSRRVGSTVFIEADDWHHRPGNAGEAELEMARGLGYCDGMKDAIDQVDQAGIPELIRKAREWDGTRAGG